MKIGTHEKQQNKMIDLSILLDYFERLHQAISKIYPDGATWENCEHLVIDLEIDHPEWVKVHFPLITIYHREKAGKLNDSKNIDTMFRNNFNVVSQLVWGPGDFWIHFRKNKHKGFKNIVAAIRATEKDLVGFDTDRQKPKKYKNFNEFANIQDPSNIHLKALCEVLNENFSCDSIGQLRMI